MNEYECQANHYDIYFDYVFVHHHIDATLEPSPRKGSNIDIFIIAVIGVRLLALEKIPTGRIVPIEGIPTLITDEDFLEDVEKLDGKVINTKRQVHSTSGRIATTRR